VNAALAAGQCDFGENYIQELQEKSAALADNKDVKCVRAPIIQILFRPCTCTAALTSRQTLRDITRVAAQMAFHRKSAIKQGQATCGMP
jgi:hypothetical protein